MKALKVTVLMFMMIFLCYSFGTAQWSGCIGCHNGTVAPAKDTLKDKFKTAEEFVKAALSSDNSMMEQIRENEEAIIAAAADIGLK